MGVLPDLRNYEITQQLPERDGAFEYAITNPSEPYDCVAIESELRQCESEGGGHLFALRPSRTTEAIEFPI
jgi:hypothetical protein